MKGCRPLTNPEISKLLKYITGTFQNRDRLLVVMGIRTGLRISELLSFKIGDIYSDGKILDSVYIQRKNTKGKTAGRSIPLHPQIKEYLTRWIDELGDIKPNMPLFHSRKGSGAISRIQAHRIITDSSKKAGLTGKLSTHSMRKTFAHKVYNAVDRDIAKCQKALGHVAITSTIAYLQVDQAEIDNVIVNLE